MILINIEVRLQLSAIKINVHVRCAYINNTRNNAMSSAVERARIDHINLGDVLEENEAMLKKVSQKICLQKHDLFTNKYRQITMKTGTLIPLIRI
ncbi:MAG: hypothetical protein M3P08_09095 [Thermoproteota archaeon]|nr:hypothetical protein [Thermoproteota archaeon]